MARKRKRPQAKAASGLRDLLLYSLLRTLLDRAIGLIDRWI